MSYPVKKYKTLLNPFIVYDLRILLEDESFRFLTLKVLTRVCDSVTVPDLRLIILFFNWNYLASGLFGKGVIYYCPSPRIKKRNVNTFFVFFLQYFFPFPFLIIFLSFYDFLSRPWEGGGVFFHWPPFLLCPRFASFNELN